MNNMLKENRKYTKDCNFIPLNDKSIFKDLKLPEDASSFILWYKKLEPSFWGFTAKAFDELSDTQYAWKLSWVNSGNGKCLNPTKATGALGFQPITGELYERLDTVITDQLKKNKKYLI